MNRRTATIAPLAMGMIFALSACSSDVPVDDAAQLQELVTTRASELGGSKVAQLTINTSPKSSSGVLSMRKDDGTTAEGSLGGGEATQLKSTPTPGLEVSALPFTDLTAVLAKAKAACNDEASADVYSTMTGKPFITSRCSGDSGSPKAQMLDGKQIEQLPDLNTAASLDKALADVKTTLGDDLTGLTLTFNSAVGGETPNLSANGPESKAGGQSCVPFMVRQKTSISAPPSCGDGPTEPSAINLSSITGSKLESALTAAMKQLKVSSTDDLGYAEVMGSGGKQVLVVSGKDDTTTATAPLG